MKLLHLSDLHLGRKIHGLSYLPDQEMILNQVLMLISEEKITAVLIAGDVYDKQIPSADAVTLFDWFLTELARLSCSVFLISGNHDSPERLQFGSSLMAKQNIHIAGIFDGTLKKAVLRDEYGTLNVYMLPFARYSAILAALPESEKMPESLTDAVSQVVQNAAVCPDERNIILYHGFVVGGTSELETSESELQLGGMQLVNADVFEPFDYTALGHIHKPQWVKKNKIRYSGSLLKYSFSEASQTKSVTVIELKEKGDISFTTHELVPDRDMRVIRGPYAALMEHAEESEDLVRAELTDDEIIPYALENLRTHYKNILELQYIRRMERTAASTTEIASVQNKSMMELLDEFFTSVYQFNMNETPGAEALLKKIIKEAEEI
ncbi:MAG: exonuclease SbcCD subunit D [Ruminococcus sp.]|nr:exonuclease SbcCD subunit D [Ruminococcus sp.]